MLERTDCPICSGRGCDLCRDTGRWPQAPDLLHLAVARWQGPVADCTGRVLATMERPGTVLLLDLAPGTTWPHEAAYVVLEEGAPPALYPARCPPSEGLMSAFVLNLPLGPKLCAVLAQAMRPAAAPAPRPPQLRRRPRG